MTAPDPDGAAARARHVLARWDSGPLVAVTEQDAAEALVAAVALAHDVLALLGADALPPSSPGGYL